VIVDKKNQIAPVAQLDRAPGFEPVGRRFESCRARFFLFLIRCSDRGPVAQLAEQLTLNQLAEGSSPSRPTRSFSKFAGSTRPIFSIKIGVIKIRGISLDGTPFWVMSRPRGRQSSFGTPARVQPGGSGGAVIGGLFRNTGKARGRRSEGDSIEARSRGS
jgi:hypothetical protein